MASKIDHLLVVLVFNGSGEVDGEILRTQVDNGGIPASGRVQIFGGRGGKGELDLSDRACRAKKKC